MLEQSAWKLLPASLGNFSPALGRCRSRGIMAGGGFVKPKQNDPGGMKCAHNYECRKGESIFAKK